MKKLFSTILVLGLLLSGNAYAEECIEGNCDNGKGILTWSDGKYEGGFRNGEFNGKGTHTSKYGILVSDYVDGRANGHGTLTLYRGDKYVGEFKNGSLDGFGTFTYPSGNKYIGDWKKNEKDGMGTSISVDGGKYVGSWKKNKKHGIGTFMWSNGSSYSGEWINDEITGKGIKTDRLASCEGNFVSGKMNGEFLCIEHKDGKAVILETVNGKVVKQYLITRNNKNIDYLKSSNTSYKPRLYYNSLTGAMRECAHDPGISGNCISFKPFNKNSYDKDTLFYNPKTGAMQTCFGSVSITGKCLTYGNFNHSKAVKDKGQLYYNPKSKKMTTCKFVDLKGVCKHYDLVPNSWAKNDGGFRMTDQNNPYYKRVPQSSQDLINLGTRMLSGGCTFGIDC
jgi:hypothetical protein